MSDSLLISLDNGAILPVRAHGTDAGADIMTPRTVVVPAGGYAVIRTGVHVQLPPNTVGMLKSKSGINVKHDIIGEGVIDEGYSGEVVVKLYNLGRTPHCFKRGEKVIQLVVMPVCYPSIVHVASVEGGERGDAGFGSTGR